MKKFILFQWIVTLAIICLGSCGKGDPKIEPEEEEEVEDILDDPSIDIPTEGLVAWYPLDAGDGKDHTANRNDGVKKGVVNPASNRHGIYGLATRFNGEDGYIEVPSKDYLSIATTGEFSVSIWMRIETLNFARTQTDEPYVHWMGKGRGGRHEYVFRIYNKDTYRPNRISGYAFNLAGGLGAGMYFQEELSVGTWMHICVVYDYPNDSIKIYRDGKYKGASTFSSYEITPQKGDAPLCIGTRDMVSFFKGVLDDLRIYNRALTDEEVEVLSQE